ncbi:hypothetical protein [Kitasatospora sp. MAA4]|uniref:hypothetical protein n=1 Tax=Kitasatospora sp. MAA4 TaxID=3035093 RepID=UPI002473CCE4|nr:hypothetical protein [Kitasatospora sp. MAA4]
MATTTDDPRRARLKRAVKKLTDAQAEYDDALFDLLTNGGYGSRKAASEMTGLTAEALRLRLIKLKAHGPAAE